LDRLFIKNDVFVVLQEDIEMMIAQFQEQDRKRQQVVLEKCLPPSPRFVSSFCVYLQIDEVTQSIETTFVNHKCVPSLSFTMTY